jgi:osmoprotectant transport system ATP-binding protein
MIRFDGVSKVFPGQVRPAVDNLSFEVPEGAVCALIGPSGCGKTTTLKMINRLVEPTSGTIHVDGREVRSASPEALRRGIGYVIQQVGLFPHETVADNVGTVPRLLGWDAARIQKRVDDLLDLVGLEPAAYRHRYPRELSGGQRQRVGVARALAADPPVMLMDEPFGAIDPITRERLQDEFLRIQQRIKKTIVFVTHDVDEALKMGDLVGLMRDGRFLQFGPPADILAHPADAFVEEFLGSDSTLKRLGLLRVGDLAQVALDVPFGPTLTPDTSLRDALSLMLEHGLDRLAVVPPTDEPAGVVTLAAIRQVASRDGALPVP